MVVSEQVLQRYLIEGFALILIIGLALALALQGQGIDQQLPLLGTFALGSYRLLQPLQQCFTSVSGLQANQASINRLNPFLLDDKQIGKVDSRFAQNRTISNQICLFFNCTMKVLNTFLVVLGFFRILI